MKELVRVIDIIEELNTFPIEYRFIGSMNSVVLAVQIYDANFTPCGDTLYLYASDSSAKTTFHSSSEINVILVNSDILYRTLDQLQDIFYDIIHRKNGLPLLEDAAKNIVPQTAPLPKKYSQETFIQDLLGNNHLYENTVNSLYDSLYRQPKELFFLMTVSTIFNPKVINLKETISYYTGYACCEYRHFIVCLVPMRHGTTLNSRTFDGLQDYLIKNDLYTGISNGFTSLLKTSVAFEQSNTALRIGMHMKKPLHFFRFEDYLIASMLQACRNTYDLFDLVHPNVMRLYQYDQEHNTEYLLTLTAYILLEKSIQAASTAIHIHRNTMFHRLEKLKNYFKIDLKDTRMTTKLHISVIIFTYLGIIDASEFQPR